MRADCSGITLQKSANAGKARQAVTACHSTAKADPTNHADSPVLLYSGGMFRMFVSSTADWRSSCHLVYS